MRTTMTPRRSLAAACWCACLWLAGCDAGAGQPHDAGADGGADTGAVDGWAQGGAQPDAGSDDVATDAGPWGVFVVSTKLIALGSVALGSQHERTFHVRNLGDEPLTVHAAWSPLALITVHCKALEQPIVLEPGEVRPLVLDIHITQEVVGAGALLVFTPEDEAVPPQKLAIHAHTHKPLPTSTLSVGSGDGTAENPLDFGPVTLGESATRLVTLSNGAQGLSITQVRVYGAPDFSVGPPTYGPAQQPPTPAMLQPSTQHELVVTFTPHGPPWGQVGGTLEITTDDPAVAPTYLKLTGERVMGSKFCAPVAPKHVEVGKVPAGTTVDFKVPITNKGKQPCHFLGLPVAGCFPVSPTGATNVCPEAYPSAFKALPPPAALYQLDPGETAWVQMRFAAPLPAPSTQEADLTSLWQPPKWRQPGPFTQPVSTKTRVVASVVPAPPAPPDPLSVAVWPPAVDLGVWPLGCQGPKTTVRLRRQGGADVHITAIALAGACAGVQAKPSLAGGVYPLYDGGTFHVALATSATQVGAIDCTLALHTTHMGQCDAGPKTGQACSTSAACAGAACVGEVFEVPLAGAVTATLAQQDGYALTPGRPHDLLFVVQGGSAAKGLRSAVAAGVDALLLAAKQWGVSLHVGVTTGATAGAKRGRLLSHGGVRIVRGDQPGAAAALKSLLTSAADPEPPDPAFAAAARWAVDPSATFDSGVSCTSDADCGDALCVADASGAKACGGANRGFRRPGAPITVVFATVDDDASKHAAVELLGVLRGVAVAAAPIAALIHTIGGLAPSGSASAACGMPVPNTLFALAGDTMGVQLDACLPSLTAGLAEIGARSFGRTRPLRPRSPLQPASVQLSAGGAPCTIGPTGWSWHWSTGLVFISDGKGCPAGLSDAITLTYDAACAP